MNAGGWTAIVDMGYVDTFRHRYPDTVKYSWWSYRFNARKNNAGWRIDYFFVSEDIIRNGWVKDAFIDNDIFGSDHCPVGTHIGNINTIGGLRAGWFTVHCSLPPVVLPRAC